MLFPESFAIHRGSICLRATCSSYLSQQYGMLTPRSIGIEEGPTSAIPAPANSQQTVHDPALVPPATVENGTIDENEWAAFERDVATPPPETSALTAEATITAAPLSAAELAAQSREQASLQRKTLREAEIEGEKEDAARQMEEEFDEMAELEERVKRLREKREQLRVAATENMVDNNEDADSVLDSEGDDEKEDDDADDSDEADDWDLWTQ